MTDPYTERLIELVNDERARRARSERQLADQKQETSRWRRRARKAELAARLSIRLPGRRPAPSSPPARDPMRIAYPAVRAGVSGAPSWLHRAVEVVDMEGLDEAGLAMLDLVIVGGDEAPAELGQWLRWEGRQPLVAYQPSGRLTELLAATTCEVLVDEGATARETLPVVEPLEPSALGSDAAIERAAQRLASSDRTARTVAYRILTAAGLDVPPPGLGVTAVAVTKRPEGAAALIDTLAGLDNDRLEVMIGTHGFELSPAERSRAEELFGHRLNVRHLSGEWRLGRCLNEVISQTTTELWAKIDDDDHYGPRYLQEAVLEIEVTGADLVGKQTHYLYDGSLDQTFLLQPGNEYRETGYVPGATFVGRRSAWEKVPFAHRHARVDSTFVRGMQAVGLSIYSTSRFEFAVGRGATTDHTWHVDDAFYEARGRKVAGGFDQNAIFLPEIDMHAPPDWD